MNPAVTGSSAGTPADPPAVPAETFLGNVRSILTKCEAPEALALLDGAGAAASRQAVVVVGEHGTGKSSLINALVGDPGLLPVHYGIGTGAFCVLGHGPQLRVMVRLADGQELIAAGEDGRQLLHQYGRADAESIPAWIEIELAEPRLDGIQIIDTPGAGGLDSALADITMRGLRMAEAVVFVSDCKDPIGEAELDFLRRASAQVDHVVFALTKVDLVENRPKMVAENQAVLAESMARFGSARVISVSALRAHQATAATRPELASRLSADSGVPALWQELRLVSPRRATLQVANQMRSARSALELACQDHRRLRALLEASDHGAALRAEAEARRVALTAWQDRSGRWCRELQNEMSKLRRTVSRHLNERSAALLARFETDHVVKAGDDDPAVRLLIAALDELQQEAAALLQERIAVIVAVAAGGVATDVNLDAELAEIVDTNLGIAVPPPATAKGGRAGEGMLQTQSIYMGTMMAKQVVLLTGIGAAATTLGALTPVGWAAAAAFGLVWAYKGAQTRRQASDAAARRTWAYRAISDAVRRIDDECAARISDAAYAIVSALEGIYPREAARLQHELAQSERVAQQTVKERGAALAVVTRELIELETHLREADKWLTDLRAVGPGSARP